MANGKHEAPGPLRQTVREIGFTNTLALYLVALLLVGLVGGFVLAVLSIKYQYAGALACWTVVFTPIGTAVSIVLGRIVEKSRAENTSADGTGIKFAVAEAAGFQSGQTAQTATETESPASVDSPAI